MVNKRYEGVDRELARRMVGFNWLVGSVLATVVLPLATPTHEIGNAGWLIVLGNALVALAGSALLLRLERVSYGVLLAANYLAMLQVGLTQWLAGGLNAPYWQLLILPVLLVSAIHPPRRIFPFFVALAATAAAPLVYEGFDSSFAATLVLGYLLWAGIGLITYRLMKELRAQRTENKRQEDHAKRLARLDPLTGLHNRRAFDEAIGEQVSLARTKAEPLSVLLADVDRFKQINDEYGHVVGDSCLRQVARTIQVSVRTTDACFRWGGDEFAVLLPNADTDRAAELCERIHSAVLTSCFDPDGSPLQVSCGYTELSEGMDMRQLLEAADLAMLTLKRSLAR
jgi:diguanylate cyclase (GGDEF)-like protein